jgi:hypothetical protein
MDSRERLAGRTRHALGHTTKLSKVKLVVRLLKAMLDTNISLTLRRKQIPNAHARLLADSSDPTSSFTDETDITNISHGAVENPKHDVGPSVPQCQGIRMSENDE